MADCTALAPLTFGSVCSGIEAASVAWHPLGWRASFLSEIEAFPRAVLSHHYPEVPLHGDFTTIRKDQYRPIDLLVGGTPCQSFSIAGLRGGLPDERGNLALEYLKLAQRLRPRWLVWENVPGVLSSAGGRDFGSILGGLVELGYGFAYRVLDAQYVRVDGFGRAVPQRRRRVFVVGCLGDWRRAAAVLFEPESLSGNPAPRRWAGEGITYDVAARLAASGRGFERAGETRGQDPVIAVADVAPTLNAHFGDKQGLEDQHINGGGACSLPRVSNPLTARMHKGINTTLDEGQTLIPTIGAGFDVAHSLRADGFDASEDGTGRGTPIVPVSFDCKGSQVQHTADGAALTLRSMSHDGSHANAGGHAAIVFDTTQITSKANRSRGSSGACHALAAGAHPPALAFHGAQDPDVSGDVTHPVGRNVGLETCALTGWRVRRLTPTECERLQGFPDGWTDIPWRGKSNAPDGPRYKALGNSMACNVMRWIGQRIQLVEASA
jgi:DNA (cytosine-5)-methyltransferase 1